MGSQQSVKAWEVLGRPRVKLPSGGQQSPLTQTTLIEAQGSYKNQQLLSLWKDSLRIHRAFSYNFMHFQKIRHCQEH